MKYPIALILCPLLMTTVVWTIRLPFNLGNLGNLVNSQNYASQNYAASAYQYQHQQNQYFNQPYPNRGYYDFNYDPYATNIFKRSADAREEVSTEKALETDGSTREKSARSGFHVKKKINNASRPRYPSNSGLSPNSGFSSHRVYYSRPTTYRTTYYDF